MQILKDDIRDEILKNSKHDFLEYGFNQTSLRTIAAKSSVTVSNIYNYFKNKNDLFTAVVSPAVSYINEILVKSAGTDFHQFDSPVYVQWHIEFINMIYRFINIHRDELILLFSKSSGSHYENFKDSTARSYAENSQCAKLALSGHEVSYFFMHNFTLFYLNFLENLALHEHDDAKIKQYLAELTIYSHGGFNALIEQNSPLYLQILNAIGRES
ncbi:MAG: hypothetical protein A2015_08940 [Spirochaetes bacterium GWF1_31_7]|nr:MAG: hypothetical protein A2Y30_06720 [Spirochaetes bacterium GWE1_32_154]OHD48046.1 MAG: hypothetical protein A2015_08940 [Spirochaetes bacterium GWF1_31_7]OHD49637.1 MAG: hypothetical protein A2Y29_06695 [Spirochaetes bacterium GWE2_31_10]OHD81731.1 MAG: hypothetical protein A2355_07490 [Spirochaetes bacterium RIFOXYB1_FULL_32_8]HBD96189.1 hypothetical protein [Spirochaetia bacterium]